MIKNHWYLCPYCGQKIQKVTPKSTIMETPLYCKRCKQESSPLIEKGKEKQPKTS